MQLALSEIACRTWVAALVLGGLGLGARTREPPVERGPSARVSEATARYPSQVIEVGRDQQWALVCQARMDTNGDGVIDPHDQRAPYVFRDANLAGELVDRVEAASNDGRWIVAARAGGLVALDVWTGHEQVMPAADLVGSGRRAKLDPGQDHLVYFRGQASTMLAVRDLATGAERAFDVGRNVEYFSVSDGPWVALRYRHPVRIDQRRPWGPRVETPCGRHADGQRGSIEDPSGPTEPDAWLDVTTGALRRR